ncbi:MAG: phosphoglycerate kinase [Gammaproteobacteria bacterium]
MFTFSDYPFKGQRVLVREDFNVPLKDGEVLDDSRLRAAVPTLQHLIKAGAAVMILSHFGRPQEGQFSTEFSLAPVADALSKLLDRPVELVSEWRNLKVEPGHVVLIENIRFEKGENSNDPILAKALASICDIVVMDAFAVSHRASASTVGVVEVAKQAIAGPLLEGELFALNQAFTSPKRPLVAVVGGSKVSTKLDVLKSLIEKVDTLIVGGGIANTFLVAAGQSIGESLYEPSLVETAKQLLHYAKEHSKTILLPIDTIVSNDIQASSGVIKTLKEIQPHDKIFDIGPRAIEALKRTLANAATVIWNGPVGVFENAAFAEGTKALAQAIAESDAFSLAGGGETLAAISQFHVTDRISYISTGGGAFLEWLAGETLPAVAALANKNH